MLVCGQLIKLQAGFGAVTQLITQWRDENKKRTIVYAYEQISLIYT